MTKSPSRQIPPIVDNENRCSCSDRILVLESQFPYLATKEYTSNSRNEFKDDIRELKDIISDLKIGIASFEAKTERRFTIQTKWVIGVGLAIISVIIGGSFL